MRKYLVFILSILAFQSSFAQFAIMKEDADSLVRAGSNFIYNVQFDEAHKCFDQVIKKYPKHPAGYFLDAMIDWWKISLYRSDNSLNKSFETKIQKVIDVTDEILDNNSKDINGLFFKAGALGYRGRYYSIKQDWVRAARDGSSAYNLLLECYKIAPGNHDIMLGTGIYNYFASAIPQMYPATKPLMLFLPKGDKQLGIYQLRASSKLARYTAIEAKVILLQVYHNFEKDVDLAQAISEELYNAYPRNPYFQKYLARAYYRKGNIAESDKQWRDILVKCMDKKPGYDVISAREAMYYIGANLFDKGDYNNSLKYFKKAEEGSSKLDKGEETGFFVNAVLYIASIYEKKNDKKSALAYYNKVLSMNEFDNSIAKAREGIRRVQR